MTNTRQAKANSGNRIAFGVLVIIVSLFCFLSDVGALGGVGRMVYSFLTGFFGLASYAYSLCGIILGIAITFGVSVKMRPARILTYTGMLLLAVFALHIYTSSSHIYGAKYGAYLVSCYANTNTAGGMLFGIAAYPLMKLITPVGALVVACATFFALTLVALIPSIRKNTVYTASSKKEREGYDKDDRERRSFFGRRDKRQKYDDAPEPLGDEHKLYVVDVDGDPMSGSHRRVKENGAAGYFPLYPNATGGIEDEKKTEQKPVYRSFEEEKRRMAREILFSEKPDDESIERYGAMRSGQRREGRDRIQPLTEVGAPYTEIRKQGLSARMGLDGDGDIRGEYIARHRADAREGNDDQKQEETTRSTRDTYRTPNGFDFEALKRDRMEEFAHPSARESEREVARPTRKIGDVNPTVTRAQEAVSDVNVGMLGALNRASAPAQPETPKEQPGSVAYTQPTEDHSAPATPAQARGEHAPQAGSAQPYTASSGAGYADGGTQQRYNGAQPQYSAPQRGAQPQRGGQYGAPQGYGQPYGGQPYAGQPQATPPQQSPQMPPQRPIQSGVRPYVEGRPVDVPANGVYRGVTGDPRMPRAYRNNEVPRSQAPAQPQYPAGTPQGYAPQPTPPQYAAPQAPVRQAEQPRPATVDPEQPRPTTVNAEQPRPAVADSEQSRPKKAEREESRSHEKEPETTPAKDVKASEPAKRVSEAQDHTSDAQESKQVKAEQPRAKAPARDEEQSAQDSAAKKAKDSFIKAAGEVPPMSKQEKEAAMREEKQKEAAKRGLSIDDEKGKKGYSQISIEQAIAAAEPPKPKRPYKAPPLDILEPPAPEIDQNEDYELKKEKILKTLDVFKITGEVTKVLVGPTFTMYKLKVTMPKGRTINYISTLENDIAMKMEVKSVRIIAPIPGEDAVGIEVPNKFPRKVNLSEILMSPEYNRENDPVSFALGKNLVGDSRIVKVRKLPHVLIAGATGAGKSCCINSLIVSMLYKASPDDVRFILIDPKKVELSVYEGIPHLLMDEIICDMDKAIRALNWAIAEMQRRIDYLFEFGYRNIEDYNADAPAKGKEKMPRIVIIVDEFAELMSMGKRAVEDAVNRLTRLSRATGMHLVLATQRPSVDVISGTIKNNLPSRIAFHVTSSFDSKTVLDSVGAEKLLGNGDLMFMMPGQSDFERMQGAFISNEDVQSVVDFIKQNNDCYFDAGIKDAIFKAEDEEPEEGQKPKKQGDAELPPEAFAALRAGLELKAEGRHFSISVLQRMLGFGYQKAARIHDILAKHGFISKDPDDPKKEFVNLTEEEIDALENGGGEEE